MKQRIRQTTLKQFNWGGKRRGAGRKPKGERAGVSHAKRPELKRERPLLVTLSIDKSEPEPARGAGARALPRRRSRGERAR
jgi:hypothetical protein